MRAKSDFTPSGFSLVETMVAVAIFGIMAAASLTMFLSQNKQMALIQSKFGNMSIASDLRATFESATLCKEAYVGDTLPAPDASASIPLKFKLLSNVIVADKADLSQAYQVHVSTLTMTHVKLVGTNWIGHPIYSGVAVLQTERPEKLLLFAPMVVSSLFFEVDKAGKVISCANFPTFSDPFVPTATPVPTPTSRYDSTPVPTPEPTPTAPSADTSAKTAADIASQLSQIQSLEKNLAAAAAGSTGATGSATSASVATPEKSPEKPNGKSSCTNGEARQSDGKCGAIMEVCMNGSWYDSGLTGQCPASTQ